MLDSQVKNAIRKTSERIVQNFGHQVNVVKDIIKREKSKLLGVIEETFGAAEKEIVGDLDARRGLIMKQLEFEVYKNKVTLMKGIYKFLCWGIFLIFFFIELSDKFEGSKLVESQIDELIEKMGEMVGEAWYTYKTEVLEKEQAIELKVMFCLEVRGVIYKVGVWIFVEKARADFKYNS